MSQLQQAKEDDATIVIIHNHQKQYRFLNMKPNEPKDYTDPHIPRTFPAQIVIRAQRLINGIQKATLPFMPLPAGVTFTKAAPQAKWQADYVFPDRPWKNLDHTKGKTLGVKMVKNLLSHIVIKDGTPEARVTQDSQEVFGTKPSGEANRMRDIMQHLLNRIETLLTQLTRQRPKPTPKPTPKPGPQMVPEPNPTTGVHNTMLARLAPLAKWRAEDPPDAPIPKRPRAT